MRHTLQKPFVGQRIDIYEVNKAGEKTYSFKVFKEGSQWPVLNVDSLLVKIKHPQFPEPLVLAHRAFSKYSIECKKVGTMIIKSLK